MTDTQLAFSEHAYLALLTDGGLTEHPFTHTTPTAGYSASYDDGVVIPFRYLRLADINSFINQRRWEDPRVYFGMWHHPTSDSVYLDRGRVFESIEAAIGFATANNQPAILDIANSETLFIERAA